MAFLRNYMRCRSNDPRDNDDDECKPDLKVKISKHLSSSASKIKSEPVFKNETHENVESIATASLELVDVGDALDVSRIFPLSSKFTNETVTIEKQAKEILNTNRESRSVKRKSSEQKTVAKQIPTDQVYEPPLKKLSKTPESSSSSSKKKEQKHSSLLTSAPPVNAKLREDKTMTFFKSIFYDFNKLTGRRQRQLKQQLMEDLNELLDEQERQT